MSQARKKNSLQYVDFLSISTWKKSGECQLNVFLPSSDIQKLTAHRYAPSITPFNFSLVYTIFSNGVLGQIRCASHL